LCASVVSDTASNGIRWTNLICWCYYFQPILSPEFWKLTDRLPRSLLVMHNLFLLSAGCSCVTGYITAFNKIRAESGLFGWNGLFFRFLFPKFVWDLESVVILCSSGDCRHDLWVMV
jgi:hypothetical protein